ncbi:hypothetical protein HMPREF9601_00448 [Cutibacterium acnes HL030PA1]|nr:hypothetical protein HMPREF9601_00448 [Cutibacterium acnes HL030PA1]
MQLVRHCAPRAVFHLPPLAPPSASWLERGPSLKEKVTVFTSL